jgi:hypothetical protein
VRDSEKLEYKMFRAFCMTIATRAEQIIRIQAHSPYPELNEALETSLRTEVLKVTQCTLEAALVEEVQQHLGQLGQNRPRRSGYFIPILYNPATDKASRIEALPVKEAMTFLVISWSL